MHYKKGEVKYTVGQNGGNISALFAGGSEDGDILM